jgi:hypothetical protein
MSHLQIDCPHCNQSVNVPQTLAGKETSCPECNQIFVVPPLASSPLSAATPSLPSDAPPDIPNHLAEAIVATLLCCLPLGIVAIVYSSQVNSKLLEGDIEGAQAASNKASMWSGISFGAGFLFILVYFLLTLASG